MGRRSQSDSDSDRDRKRHHRKRRSRSRDKSDNSPERSSSRRRRDSRKRSDDKYKSSTSRSRRRSRSRARESKNHYRRRSRSSSSEESTSSKSRSKHRTSEKRLSEKSQPTKSTGISETAGADLKSRIAQIENRETSKIDSPAHITYDESVLKSISEAGFSQALFKSSGQRQKVDSINSEDTKEQLTLTSHEKAMFGQTASTEERFSSVYSSKRKTIERPLLSDSTELQSTSIMDVNVFGEDPKVRMQRWKEKLSFMQKQLNKPISINLNI